MLSVTALLWIFKKITVGYDPLKPKKTMLSGQDGAQHFIACRTWYVDCRLNDNSNNNNDKINSGAVVNTPNGVPHTRGKIIFNSGEELLR